MRSAPTTEANKCKRTGILTKQQQQQHHHHNIHTNTHTNIHNIEVYVYLCMAETKECLFPFLPRRNSNFWRINS